MEGKKEEKKKRNEGTVKCGCTTSETVRKKTVITIPCRCVCSPVLRLASATWWKGMQNDFSAEIRAIRIGCNLNGWKSRRTWKKGNEKRDCITPSCFLFLSLSILRAISEKIGGRCLKIGNLLHYFRRKIYTEGLNARDWKFSWWIFAFFIFPANIFRANGNFFGACWLDAIEGVKGGRFFLSFGIRHRSTMFLFRSWICKRVKWIWECIGFFTCATNRSFDWPFVFMVFLQLVSLRYVTSWEGSENIRILTSQSFENRD